MKEIKVSHLGEDYATIDIEGEEYETSKGLGEALMGALEQKKPTDQE